MKFDKGLVEMLKNISTINTQMYFVAGDEQSVISPLGTGFVSIKLDFPIEQPFAILSLPKFLSILSLYNDPEIVITPKFLEISSENDKKICKYQLTNPDFIKYEKNPQKFNKMVNDISFDLKYSDYSAIMKLGAILKSEFIYFQGDGTKIYLEVNSNSETGDSGILEIGETDIVFKAAISKDTLNLLENDYNVGITKRGALCFKSDKIKYFFAVNKDKSSL